MAAVDAKRAFLAVVEFDARIVTGEGEKDAAPTLFDGERVGTGSGAAADIAVEPTDGTSLTAQGRQNALSMIAVADDGAMLDASSVFSMAKLVADVQGVGVLDMERPIESTALLLDGDVAGGVKAAMEDSDVDLASVSAAARKGSRPTAP